MTRRVLSCIYPLIAPQKGGFIMNHTSIFFESGLPAEHRPFYVQRYCLPPLFFRTFDSRCRLTGSCNSFPISRHIKNWRFFLLLRELQATASGFGLKKSSKSAVASVNTYGRVTAKSGHLHDYGKSRRWGSQL